MNKRIFLTALFCTVLISSSFLHAIVRVSSERVEQHKEQLKTKIYYARIVRVTAAVGLLGAGAYMLKKSITGNTMPPVLPLSEKEIIAVRMDFFKKRSEQNDATLHANSDSWLSWSASLVKSGFISGTNLLGLVTLNVIGGEVFPYVRSAISALLRYPGSAIRFYTVHACVPEILNEYTHYAKILAQEHMYDVEDVEYASLYFLHEYDEIVYRIEKLLAYILLMGEQSSDMKEDGELLVDHLTHKTNQLARSLYLCGMGNCPDKMVEKIKEFETELTSTIRLCKKSF